MLEIEKTVIEPEVVVVAVAGRIQLGRECQRVQWTLEELIQADQKRVVLDLEKVDYLDSAGVGILVTCCGKMEAAGGEILIACAQPKVDDVFRVSKLRHIMRFYPTVAEAAGRWASA